MTAINTQDHAHPYLKMFNQYVSDNKISPVFKMEVIIHTKDKDITNSENIYLHNLTVNRDYENNIGDHIEAQISIPPGTFIEDVFPYLDNCEVTIRVKKQYTVGSATEKKPFVSTTKYKAIFLKDKNASLPNNKLYSKVDMNQQPSFILTLQLMDKSVEALRIKTAGGSFSISGVKGVKEALKTVLSSEASKVFVENKPSLDFIHMYEPDNPGDLKSLTMPSFSRVIEIPDYVQEKSVGVYNSGLGCYIQKCAMSPTKIKTGMWVYPLYTVKRDNVETMEIYCPTIESSLVSLPGAIHQDNRYVLLAYKPSVQANNKEAGVMGAGSGFRSADASKMMTKPVKVTQRGPVFEREKLNTEVIYKEREDGINFAVNKGTYFNNFALASSIMKAKLNFIILQISNLDHDVIRPGVNIRLSTLVLKPLKDKDESKVNRTYDCNVLQAVFSYTNNNPSPLMSVSSRFTDLTCHATLKLCAEERLTDADTTTATNNIVDTTITTTFVIT